MIVVLGVFLGLQVNEWNEAREGRAKEAFYLDRLREEAELTERSRIGIDAMRSRRLLLLREAAAGFFDVAGVDDLDADHCRAVVNAHILVPENYAIPTLEELIATGDLDLIRDPAVRRAISAFETFRKGPLARYNDLRSARESLALRFPDHFEVARVYLAEAPPGPAAATARGERDVDLIEYDLSCDFAGMTDDAAFLIAFAEYISVYSYYSAFVTEPERRLFNDLFTALGAAAPNPSAPEAATEPGE